MSTQAKIDQPFPTLSLPTVSGESLVLGQPPQVAIDQARDLGLYISSPLDSAETERPFAEPGMFFIRPDGGLHFNEAASVPFCRPDLEMIKVGIGIIQEKNTRLEVLAGQC